MLNTISGANYLFWYRFQYPIDKPYSDCADTELCLAQLKWNDNLAVSTPRVRAENCPLIDRSEMYCFSQLENLYTFPIALNMQSKYEYFPHICALLRRSVEAGLIDKWHRDSRMYQHDRKREDDRRIILTIAHIGAALLALGCGSILASLVFIAEWIAFRKTKKSDCHEFWVFLSKVVDGRRFYFQ